MFYQGYQRKRSTTRILWQCLGDLVTASKVFWNSREKFRITGNATSREEEREGEEVYTVNVEKMQMKQDAQWHGKQQEEGNYCYIDLFEEEFEEWEWEAQKKEQEDKTLAKDDKTDFNWEENEEAEKGEQEFNEDLLKEDTDDSIRKIKSTHSYQASLENPTPTLIQDLQQHGMPKVLMPVTDGPSRQVHSQPQTNLMMGQTIYSIMVAVLFLHTAHHQCGPSIDTKNVTPLAQFTYQPVQPTTNCTQTRQVLYF